MDPFNQLDAEIGDLERQLEVLRRRKTQQTAELWATYRPGYEHYPLVGDASEWATS